MSNAAISLSPEATIGALENGSQRASSGSMIGRDASAPFGSVPRGIGFAHDDVVRTGEELHVTSKTPVWRSYSSGTRLVIALASITTGGAELDLSIGKVDVLSGTTVVLTLDKAHPQQIVEASGGAWEFRLTHPKWYSDGAPCANVVVALAE